MSKVTISAIKADVGGYVGHSAVHPDLLATATERVREAIADELLLDGRVGSCGDDVNLVLTHTRGVDDEDIHEFAWGHVSRGDRGGKTLAPLRRRAGPARRRVLGEYPGRRAGRRRARARGTAV